MTLLLKAALTLCAVIGLGVLAGAQFAPTGLGFTPNQGRWNKQAIFVHRERGLNTWITRDSMVVDQFRDALEPASPTPGYLLNRAGERLGHVVRFHFSGALGGRPVKAAGADEVELKRLYRGVDVVYRLDQGHPRYDLHLKAGVDPAKIGFDIEGADKVSVAPDGSLLIKNQLGVATQSGSTVYLNQAGLTVYQGKTKIPAHFVLKGSHVSFAVGPYDKHKPLVIDPLLYSSFLGGQGDNETINAVTLGRNGDIIVAGATDSLQFPTSIGSYQTRLEGTQDAFVARLSGDGSVVKYSTLLGGLGQDLATGVATNSADQVVITGRTTSTNFPVTAGALQASNHERGGQPTAFLTILSPSLNHVNYSTYLGGSGATASSDIPGDQAMAVAVNPYDNIYVVGSTSSDDFPTVNAAQPALQAPGSHNGFACLIARNGASYYLAASTYLGGAGRSDGYLHRGDAITALTVDPGGRVFIGGQTSSQNFPGAAPDLFGNSRAFVCEISDLLGTLYWTQTYDGDSDEWVSSLTTDAFDHVWGAGGTTSLDFPVTPSTVGARATGASLAWVTRLDKENRTSPLTTLIGGSRNQSAVAIQADPNGNPWVVGNTSSTDFLVGPTALQSRITGIRGLFLSILNPNLNAFLYSTVLGGSSNDEATAMVYQGGRAVIAGGTESADFPVTYQARYKTLNGYSDAFVSLVSPSNSTFKSLSFAAASVTGGSNATATLAFARPLAAGTPFRLISSDTAVGTVPASLSLSTTSTSFSFLIHTNPVSSDTPLTVTAIDPTGEPIQGSFIVAAPIVRSLAISPQSGDRNTVISGRVTIASPAPAEGLTLLCNSTNGSIKVPSTITIPPGATTAAVPVTCVGPAGDTEIVRISVGSAFSTYTLKGPIPLSVAYASTSPHSGTTLSAYLTMSAPPGVPVTISLVSNNPAVVPAQTFMLSGSATVTVPVKINKVSYSTSADIYFSANGISIAKNVAIIP